MDTNKGLQALFEDDESLEDSKNPDVSNVEGKTIGKYVIGSEVGSGGMGSVYLAKDTSLGRTVVIKVVKFPSRDQGHRRMMAARFRREAQAACRVMHPNVAVTFAFDEIDGRHLLVMEWIDGRTLRDEIVSEFGRPRAMERRKAVAVVIGILKGLEAIHAAKIVHRDMKPGNVMLTRQGDQVKILDFGLGKAAESFGDPALDMTLTQQGMPIGSPLYMSPEQTRSLPVDERTDIYSVGVLLFALLTGKPPFSGKDPIEIFEKHRNAPVPPLFTPTGPVPQGLEAVVRKAMAKTPEERYASAIEMRAALEKVSFDPKPKITAKRPSSIRPWIAASAAFCAAAALVVGLVLTMGKVSAPERGPEAVIKIAKAAAPAKSVEDGKASGGISIPPPPPVMATVAQGCELYTRGQTTEAIATLTRALAKSPGDVDGLYCLCGSYARQPESRADAQKACKAYLARPRKDADKTKQVDLWLRRLR